MLDDHLQQLVNITAMKGGPNGPVQDAAGGVDREPYTVVYARVPVLIREEGGSRDRRNDKATQTNIGRLYFTADYGLTTRNRLEVLDRAGAAIRELVITNVSNVNSLDRLWQVDFEEVAV